MIKITQEPGLLKQTFYKSLAMLSPSVQLSRQDIK